MKNILVGQSGGPTAVINGSLYGVIKEGLRFKDDVGHVYGMINGIEGFLKDNYRDMDEEFTQDGIEYLKTISATFSILAATTPWIPSASSPATVHYTAAMYALSVSQKLLTMTSF